MSSDVKKPKRDRVGQFRRKMSAWQKSCWACKVIVFGLLLSGNVFGNLWQPYKIHWSAALSVSANEDGSALPATTEFLLVEKGGNKDFVDDVGGYDKEDRKAVDDLVETVVGD